MWLEKKEKRDRKEEELRKMKDKKKIWNYINSRRKKKEWIENNIQKEKWRMHFMKLLGGTEIKAKEVETKIGVGGALEINEEQVQNTVSCAR